MSMFLTWVFMQEDIKTLNMTLFLTADPIPYSISICQHYYYFMKTIIHSLLKENKSIDLLNSAFYFP